MSPPSSSADGLLLEEFPSCRGSNLMHSDGDLSTVLYDEDDNHDESQGSSLGLLLEDFPPRRASHKRFANVTSSTVRHDADANHSEHKGGEAQGDGRTGHYSNHVISTTNQADLSRSLHATRRSPLDIFRKIRSSIHRHYSAGPSLDESSHSPVQRHNAIGNRKATASTQQELAAGPDEATVDFQILKQKMRSTGKMSTAGAHRAIMLQSGGGRSTTPPRSPIRDPNPRECLGFPSSVNAMFPLPTRDTEPTASTNFSPFAPPRSPVRDQLSREFLGFPSSLLTMSPLSSRDPEPCPRTNLSPFASDSENH